jgi:hypothetical protein
LHYLSSPRQPTVEIFAPFWIILPVSFLVLPFFSSIHCLPSWPNAH